MFSINDDLYDDDLYEYFSNREEMEQSVLSCAISLQQDNLRYQIEDLVNKFVDDRISLLKEFAIKQSPMFYNNIDVEIGKVFHRFMGNYFDRRCRE